MKGTSILVGMAAVAVFLAAFLFTAQVRGDGQSSDRAGERTEGGICLPPALGEHAGSPAGIASTIEGEPVLKLLPPDAIAAVDEPKMVPAAAAAGFMRDDEMVIGVTDGQEARAYSVWHLDRHEIVNDRLGDAPIAATW